MSVRRMQGSLRIVMADRAARPHRGTACHSVLYSRHENYPNLHEARRPKVNAHLAHYDVNRLNGRGRRIPRPCRCRPGPQEHDSGAVGLRGNGPDYLVSHRSTGDFLLVTFRMA